MFTSHSKNTNDDIEYNIMKYIPLAHRVLYNLTPSLVLWERIPVTICSSLTFACTSEAATSTIDCCGCGCAITTGE